MRSQLKYRERVRRRNATLVLALVAFGFFVFVWTNRRTSKPTFPNVAHVPNSNFVALSKIGALRSADASSSSSSSTSHAQQRPRAAKSLDEFLEEMVHVSPSKDKHRAIAERLMYWSDFVPEPETSSGLFALPNSETYVMFLTDCGGFNNIREVVEYVFLIAWLTKRTLVLPPPSGWYLIDFGPFARMKPEPTDELVTHYAEFFNMDHVKAAVSVISTDEYIARHEADIPNDVLRPGGKPLDLSTHAGRKVWQHYLKSDETELELLPWSPLQHVVYWPSIASVDKKYPSPNHVPSAFIHHRAKVEFTPEIAQKREICFPSCKDNTNYRFLGQVAAFAAFENEALSRSYKRVLRNNFHYVDVVFDVAARVVQAIGEMEQRASFSALHVRRNDLQYKEVFLSADKMISNVESLLRPNEVIYVATDEKDPKFFDSFTNKGYTIYRWKDFFEAKGNFALKDVHIPRKLEGCIEQVICASGRIFAGTLESTFSSYIFRLRGYLETANTEIYFHTLGPYVNDQKKDREITWAKKPEKGQIYKSEFRSIWEDAVSTKPTSWR